MRRLKLHCIALVIISYFNFTFFSCAHSGGLVHPYQTGVKLDKVVDQAYLVRIHFEREDGKVINRVGYLKSTPSIHLFLLMPEFRPSGDAKAHSIEILSEKIRLIELVDRANAFQIIIPLVIIGALVTLAIMLGSALKGFPGS